MRRWWLPSSAVAINLSFAAALALVVFVGAVLARTTHEANEAAGWVRHTEQVLQALADTRESFARVEAAQRGYLLTDVSAYLQERDRWIVRLHASLDTVQTLTRDNAKAQELARVLEALVRERIVVAVENARTRDRFDDKNDAAQRLQRAQVLSDRMAATASAMEQQERRLLAERQSLQLERQRRTTWMVPGTFAVFLLVLVPAYFSVLHQARGRRRVEQQMTELVEQLPLTLWQLRRQPDGTTRMLYVGSRVAAERGVDRDALMRHGDAALAGNVLDEDRPRLLSALERAQRARAPFECEYRIALPDGALRWIRSNASLQPQADGSTLWTGYWADITAQKELEAALKQATEEANRANRAKSTFLATMSHEIRTPMNGVLGLLELLGLSRLDSEQRATLEVVSESGRGLLRIIDDILDFSKVEAGRLALDPVPASVPELVKRACQIHSGIASSRGLLLQQETDPRISPALVFDPLRVGQILNNFISNALKFTAEGGVTVAVQSLSRGEHRERLRFSVQDTGIGLPQEALERLFEPFTQAEAGTAASFGGTGLGLAICRRLAEMMGGSVRLDSREGEGTTAVLEVEFPIASPDALVDPAAEGSPQRELSGTVAARRLAPPAEAAEAEGSLVLVVDDHPTNRLVLSRQVAALGYGLLLAEDGREALELWRTRRIGLVLTDCNMPQLSGYDFARAVREEEQRQGRPRVPIIACTANALGNEGARCLAAGMDDFLIKPVNLVDLMQRMDLWLPLSPMEDAPPTRPPAMATPRSDAALDGHTLAAITGGDPVVQREVLLDFRHVNDADLGLLKSEVERFDREQVLLLAHRIKGAARTLGAQRVTACCERLEHATRAGDPRGFRAAFASLEEEVHLLNDHIDALTTETGRTP